MSGGSYDYLCHKDEDDIHEYGALGNLERMAQRLLSLGYDVPAKKTLELYEHIRWNKLQVQVKIEALADIWHAVEWLDSCDYDEKHAREIIEGIMSNAAHPEEGAE